MKSIFSIALATAVLWASGAYAQSTNGECNNIWAKNLGMAQKCLRGPDCYIGSSACNDIANAFLEFATDPFCIQRLAEDEAEGLLASASTQPSGPDEGSKKKIDDAICGAVNNCGLCAGANSLNMCNENCL